MARTKAEKIAAAKKRHNFKRINTPRRGGPKKFEVLAVEGNTVKKIKFHFLRPLELHEMN